MTKVVVVGGGLAGLVAARDLLRAGADVHLLEASDRLGGKLWSSPVGDRLVDAGPDSFLVRRPEAVELVEELGLADELTHPVSPVGAYIWRDGHLRNLPARSWLGIPTDPSALADSDLVSETAVGMVRSEPQRPAAPLTQDCAVGAYFRDRLGDEITERLIDPLIGGVNAGDVDHLSLQASSPQLWDLAAAGGSLLERLGDRIAAMGPGLGSAAPAAVFGSINGGLHRLVDALVDSIASATVDLGRGAVDVGTRSVSTSDGEAIRCDGVIVASPSATTARLLRSCSEPAATVFAAIPHATVSQVTFAFDLDQIDTELDASGILFPRVDGGLMTACTWFSTKWPHYRREHDGRRQVVIRCTSGRYLDDRANNLPDAALVEQLENELRLVVGWVGRPEAIRVHRWVDGFPQYLPGHLGRIRHAEAALARDLPDVRLAGMSLRGIGIPAVIGGARAAARELVDS